MTWNKKEEKKRVNEKGKGERDRESHAVESR